MSDQVEKLKAYFAFQSGLKSGSPVNVRWTNCGRYYSVSGKVTKINKASVLVAIDEPILSGDTIMYNAGREIKAPLFTTESLDAMKKHSDNNGVFPLMVEAPVFASKLAADRAVGATEPRTEV